ncbi:hypothetical protein NDU88_005181 [Pleurodeles waltl]|uniref:Uncharacterized protein n=1 Tax=Pleurodeles waltl TaxID=8319 RepID=A0AAV7W747_PLEWA|nr:hypothetical protein NDU88_005181 [Pleurodeles waltl]
MFMRPVGRSGDKRKRSPRMRSARSDLLSTTEKIEAEHICDALSRKRTADLSKQSGRCLDVRLDPKLNYQIGPCPKLKLAPFGRLAKPEDGRKWTQVHEHTILSRRPRVQS